MSFTPTKEQLLEIEKYINKNTDDFGIYLKVKVLIEQAEKVQRYEKALMEIAEGDENSNPKLIAESALKG